MAFAERVEQRIDFALNSPDFWRGLVIALAVLAAFAVLRTLFNVLRAPQVRPFTTGRVAQASGLLSWLMVAVAAVGDQVTRLGTDSFSWRLPFTLLGALFGVVWAYNTIKSLIHSREKKKEQTPT